MAKLALLSLALSLSPIVHVSPAPAVAAMGAARRASAERIDPCWTRYDGKTCCMERVSLCSSEHVAVCE